jgi:hypothetical protein
VREKLVAVRQPPALTVVLPTLPTCEPALPAR